MADELVADATPAAPAADPSATATGQTNDGGGLAASLGDGTGGSSNAKSTDGTATGDPAPKPSDKPASGAPEKYEAWKVPEGYELDAGLVEEASPIFKELGLTQDQSQKLVDFYAKHSLASSKEAIDAWVEQRAQWRESMKSDPVLGKLADKSGGFSPDSPLVSTINQALNGLQNPTLVSDFKAAMDLTGAGDNPAFVKILHALAKQVTEGTEYATGGPVKGNSSRPSPGAAMYPHLPSGT